MKLNVQKPSERSISKTKDKTVSQTPIKAVSHREMLDKHLGKIGTPKRDKFEHKLRMEVIAYWIKKARLEQNLTQEQLGRLVGVQKAQISKLENSVGNVTISTILKVFKALKAVIHFKVKLAGEYQSFT